MEALELLELITRGEDSRQQFKKNITNGESLAGEFVAFSNGLGGRIFIGVDDLGSISGLSNDDIRRLNQLVSNTSSQSVQPAINPLTENIQTDKGLVMVVTIPPGINKPYQDKNGVFWVKSGSDKRRATSREEIQRLFQVSNLVHADESLAPGTTVADMDMDLFRDFFQKRYGHSLDKEKIPLPKVIDNLNLGQNGTLNLTGLLLFGSEPFIRLPVFIVKAGSFPGNSLTTDQYLDSRDIKGRMSDIFQQTVSFILTNIHHIQGNKTVNSEGEPEIPRIAIEELVANALVHRDYFISAPIRVFVFTDRVEIISPGHLPNNLTVENIKAGNSNVRNPVLTSFAYQLLPYRGYGSGILRALEAYPDIDFTDDREGSLFKVTIRRK
jgi:ATP-dependent DNA helicase RecG